MSILNLKSSFFSWRIWYSLGLQDILMRYRGSVLGPFWITINTAISAFSMGYLYGILLGIDRSTFLPYFTAGIMSWNFISSTANDSTRIFRESKSYLENIPVPPVVYIFRLVFRNMVIFAHTLPVYIAVAVIYQIKIDFHILLLIPTLFILCSNAIFYGTVIAFMSARFPDVGSIVSNILQILFFITPIMWSPDKLPPQYHLFLSLNPFYYFVNLIRNPLLGLSFDLKDAMGVAILTALGLLLFAAVIKTYSRRVIFWL